MAACDSQPPLASSSGSTSDDAVLLQLAVERVTENNEKLFGMVMSLETRVAALENNATGGLAGTRVGPCLPTSAGRTPSSNPPASVGASTATDTPALASRSTPTQRMCDCCYTTRSPCTPCEKCGKEWYCSAQCQRLRSGIHGPRCRKLQKTGGLTDERGGVPSLRTAHYPLGFQAH